MANLRRTLINKRRKRKEKLGKLRRLYKAARTDGEKQKVLEKLFKVAPHFRVDEFLATINRKTNVT